QRARGGNHRLADEIADPLELIARARGIGRYARLDLAAESNQGLRIERREEVATFRHRVGGGYAEQAVVQPELTVQRMPRRHPVDGPLYPAAVRRVPAPGGRIVGGVDFHDLTRGILHDPGAGHQVAVPQTHLASRGEPEELL